jgi:hypothetical protein
MIAVPMRAPVLTTTPGVSVVGGRKRGKKRKRREREREKERERERGRESIYK